MKRVLIVRTSAIGDVVFAAPFATALKAAHPDARLSWLVEPGIDTLLRADPAIDELLLWPRARWADAWRKREWRRLITEVRQFRHQLRARHFDTVIDLQGLLKSGVLAAMSNAPRRIGLGSREGSQWLMTEVHPRGGIASLIGSEYRFLAETLRFGTDAFVPRLHVLPEVSARARTLAAQKGFGERPYAVIAPFTTRPQKHWFAEHWRALLPQLRESLGLSTVILGGPADCDAARMLSDGLIDAHALAGSTRLDEAAALVSDAALVIGVDTGLTHMGTAFGVPTVAIFGSTRPYLNTGRDNGKVLWLGLECSPCRRNPTCHGAFTCLRDITPDAVLAAARKMLALGRRPECEQ